MTKKTKKEAPVYPYISIRQVGVCTSGGRSQMSFGFSGKTIGSTATPLARFVESLVGHTEMILKYEDVDEMNADLDAAIRYLTSLKRDA